MNQPEALGLAAVLSARFGGNEVEVAGAADGAEVTIENLPHRGWELKLSRTLSLRVGGRGDDAQSQ